MEENHNQIESDELSKIAEKFDETLTLESSPSTSSTLAQNHENREDDEDEDEEDEEEEDEDGEFEFCFVGGNLSSPVAAEEVFEDGQIRIIAPFSGEEDEEQPSTPKFGAPVKNLYVVSSTDENDGVAEGPYCVWKSPTPEMSRKSNSTGFSRLWKVRELLARSNSDGKDAFVFLKGKSDETTSSKEVKVEKKEKKKVVKTKKKEKSAYEELYGGGKDKKKGGGKSYLPYRQDLVGFFTNGTGLSRNVHPY